MRKETGRKLKQAFLLRSTFPGCVPRARSDAVRLTRYCRWGACLSGVQLRKPKTVHGTP
jgi:hypothetical protein